MPEDEIVVGAGADEILDLVAKAFLPAGATAILPIPTYAMYGVLSSQRAARLVAVPAARCGGRLRTGRARDREGPAGAAVVWLCAPNNPTGAPEPLATIERVLEAAATLGAGAPLVVVDEAYFEFWRETAVPLRTRYQNLVVVRTVSKAFALAGDPGRLRGRGAARPSSGWSASGRRGASPRSPRPWPTVALGEPQIARENVRRLEAEREWLSARLAEAGWQPYPSVTNFLLVRIGDQAASEEASERLLRGGSSRERSARPTRCAATCGSPSAAAPRTSACWRSSAHESKGCPRRAERTRETKETKIRVELDLDGLGRAEVNTGVGFFDHLLSSLAHHALFDLTVEATGDLHVDEHHTVEDVSLVFGEALAAALGDRAGIVRFGEASVPMDEAIATAVVDISGRPYAVLDIPFRADRIGTLPSQLVDHALESFARTAGLTLHLRASGRNDHHVAEAAFKALARALRAAVALDERRIGVPSTKGSLA